MNELNDLNYSFFFLQQYFENRLKTLAALKAAGNNPYPHKFYVSMSVLEYIEKYGGLDSGEHLENVEVSLAGIFLPENYVIYISVISVPLISVFFLICRTNYEQTIVIFKVVLL